MKCREVFLYQHRWNDLFYGREFFREFRFSSYSEEKGFSMEKNEFCDSSTEAKFDCDISGGIIDET
jgi:hypothetical protein